MLCQGYAERSAQYKFQGTLSVYYWKECSTLQLITFSLLKFMLQPPDVCIPPGFLKKIGSVEIIQIFLASHALNKQ